MLNYKKKPVIIQAIQWDGTNIGEIREFFGNFLNWSFKNCDTIVIKTLEGEMEASKMDYIIKGLKGEFYPCKPEIFNLSYDIA